METYYSIVDLLDKDEIYLEEQIGEKGVGEEKCIGGDRQNMYNRSISFNTQTIFNLLNIMLPYVDIIDLCHSVAIL